MLAFFELNLKLASTSFAAAFSLTVCIRHADNDLSYRYIAEAIKTDQCLVMMSKYFKRVLVSYIEFCSQAQVEEMAVRLKTVEGAKNSLEDRYMSFILLMFIKRQHQPVLKKVLWLIKTSIDDLFNKTNFKFIMMKCLDQNCTTLHRQL